MNAQPPGQTVIEIGKNITTKIKQSNIDWMLFLYLILGILAFIGLVYGIIKAVEYGKEKSKVIPSKSNNKTIEEKQLDAAASRIDKISINRNGSIGATANQMGSEGYQDFKENAAVIEAFVAADGSTYARPHSKNEVEAFEDKETEKNEVVRKEVKDDTSLVNYLTLGCRLGGYLGPKMNGVFSEGKAITNAVRSGARLFVFDIDFMVDNTERPLIVCRDSRGNLLSNNTGSIRKCMESLATAIRIGQTMDDPVIVVLSVLRLPITQPMAAEALRYMQNIAKELQPIVPYLLKQTSEGNFQQQKMADELFLMPISTFKKKIILLTNLDTRGFRSNPLPAGFTLSNGGNLDLMVHARIYSNDKQSGLPNFQPPLTTSEAPKVAVRVDTLQYYTTIPHDRKDNIINQTRTEFTIALEPEFSDDVPSELTLNMLHNELGVNCVPINFFYNEEKNPDVVKTGILSNKWFGRYSYVMKMPNLRYKIPDVVTIPKPSAKANTGGGFIRTPQI